MPGLTPPCRLSLPCLPACSAAVLEGAACEGAAGLALSVLAHMSKQARQPPSTRHVALAIRACCGEESRGREAEGGESSRLGMRAIPSGPLPEHEHSLWALPRWV